MHNTLFGLNLNDTELPGYCNKRIPVPRVLCHNLPKVTEVPGGYKTCLPGYCDMGRTELTEIPGTGTKVLQQFQKFRILWHRRTELTEVPRGYKTCCTRTPDIVAQAYRTSTGSGYGYECRTELTEVPGTGMNVLQNLQKFCVG